MKESELLKRFGLKPIEESVGTTDEEPKVI